MRILIDGYYLNKPRGMGRYVRELIFALSEFPEGEIKFLVVVQGNCEPDNYILGENIEYIKTSNKLPFPIWEQIELPKLIKKLDVDIVHFPYNTFTLKKLPVKKIITVHDLMFMDKSHKVGSNYQRLGNMYRKYIVKKLKQTNYEVISVSQATRYDLIETFNVNSEVIYTPVESFIRTVKDSIDDAVIKDYPYIYHVGGTSPHKNTEKVIRSFLNSNICSSVKLYISGTPKENWLSKKYNHKNIVFTGWLEDKEIAELYKNSLVVIFPSLREGYGLPIIEAMGFGAPVITSNINPMKEISGEAALHVNPNSEKEIIDAINTVVNDEQSRLELKKKSKIRYNDINSKTMAEKTLNIYWRSETR